MCVYVCTYALMHACTPLVLIQNALLWYQAASFQQPNPCVQVKFALKCNKLCFADIRKEEPLFCCVIYVFKYFEGFPQYPQILVLYYILLVFFIELVALLLLCVCCSLWHQTLYSSSVFSLPGGVGAVIPVSERSNGGHWSSWGCNAEALPSPSRLHYSFYPH